jgi:hypothetical protein
MKIPVFVSCPTVLSESQAAVRQLIVDELDALDLEPRALGRSDYPYELPLREVLTIARHCSGGVILGFSQFWVESGFAKRDTASERQIADVAMPSAWNHLEAGVLFGLRVPLLVFCEPTVEGGVFDHGVSDAFIHAMPSPEPASDKQGLRSVFLKWSGHVREHYYSI